MSSTTHNGKIGRLPRNIRDELNQRLEEGEPGGRILEWLNALPAVQAAGVGGGGINAQNLSNLAQGGFQEWLRQQARRNLVRELTENASELATDAGGVELSNHWSAMLVAELVESARNELAAITDPAVRCARREELLQTLARVRRQDNLAGRLALERERRARERVKEREKDDYRREKESENWAFVRSLRRSTMTDLYASPDFTSQALATQEAESLLRDAKLAASRPDGSGALDKPVSN